MSSGGELISFRTIIIAVISIVAMVVLLFFTVGKMGKGCYMRYSVDEEGNISDNASTVLSNVLLRSDGNYEVEVNDGQVKRRESDEAYGKWLNTNMQVKAGDKIDVKITGDVSLCLAQMPRYNFQQLDNVYQKNPKKYFLQGKNDWTLEHARVKGYWGAERDVLQNTTNVNAALDVGEVAVDSVRAGWNWFWGNENEDVPIRIPRVESGEFVDVIVDGNIGNYWRNLLSLKKNDLYTVVIKKEEIGKNVLAYDFFNRRYVYADCMEGKDYYSPICGRYSYASDNGLVTIDCQKTGIANYCTKKGYEVKGYETGVNCRNDYINALNYYVTEYYKYIKTLPRKGSEPNCDEIVKAKVGDCIVCHKFCNYTCSATKHLIDSLRQESRKEYDVESLFRKTQAYSICSSGDYGTYKKNKHVPIRDYVTREPYKFDADFHMNWNKNDFGELGSSSVDCSDPKIYDNPTAMEKVRSRNNLQQIWFSANYAGGLLYQFDKNEKPSPVNNAKPMDGEFAEVQNSELNNIYDLNIPYRLLMHAESNENKYLQMRLHTNLMNAHNEDYLNKRNDNNNKWYHSYNRDVTDNKSNTGGYVIGISQTACRHKNGEFRDYDNVKAKGAVSYVILPAESDANQITIDRPGESVDVASNEDISARHIAYYVYPNSDGNGVIEIPDDLQEGTIWLKIENGNNKADYRDSYGNYEVQLKQFTKKNNQNNEFIRIIDYLATEVLESVSYLLESVFKNVTCYKKADTSSCTNYFNYIRGMITLYVIILAIMFATGSSKLNAYNLLFIIMKVIIITGLMNEATVGLLIEEIGPFLKNGSNSIISNFSGYDALTLSAETKRKFSNPLVFMIPLFKRITSEAFGPQMFALFSLGFAGVFYFVIIMVSLAIMCLVTLKAIAVFVMAGIGILLLVALAPLFITFVLFDQTRYLFDNWIRFILRYIIEPVILLVGLSFFYQLYTIYLDYAIGYSVCWRCVLPFPLFVSTKFIPIPEVFTNIKIFCISWFVPWGYDAHSPEQYGVPMQFVVSVLILAYGMYHYVKFSSSIAGNLIGGGVGPGELAHKQIDKASDKINKKLGLDKESEQKRAADQKQKQKQNKKGRKDAKNNRKN